MSIINPDAPVHLTPADVRPEVMQYAILMERELRKNEHKGGWKHDDKTRLFSEVMYHARKLEQVWYRHEHKRYVQEYAVDVGNCAMMFLDVAGLLTSEEVIDHAKG